MLKRLLGFLVFCFVTSSAFTQEKDSIVLYNGQTLIGTIQDASLGTIEIDDIDLKMISIKLFKIKRLYVRERLKIELVNKQFYYGSLGTSAQEGWTDIRTDSGKVIPIKITHIFHLVSMESSVFQRMNGSVGAGFSYAKSSGIGQFTLNANIQYASRLVEYQLTASSIASLDSSKFSRDNENLQLYANYDLTGSWFIAAGMQYQRNLELSIARRFLGMAGAGNKLIIRKNLRLLLITGMTFSTEKSTEGVSSSLLYEVPVMFQFNFYQFRHPDIQISSSQSMYISLSQPGRIRYDGNTNFSWQLIRYFYLNISPYMNYDSKPPAGSNSTFDYGIVLGLSYKF